MYNLSKYNNQYINLGISQRERENPILNPNYFSIDEFDLEQFLKFIMLYSKNLAFFNEKNKLDGDWYSFLENNSTIALLRIKFLGVKELRIKSIQNTNILLHSSTSKGYEEKNRLFLYDIIDYFKNIESNVTKLRDYSVLKDEIIEVIRQNLSFVLHDIIYFLSEWQIGFNSETITNEFNLYWLVDVKHNPVKKSIRSLEQSISTAVNSIELIQGMAAVFYKSKVVNSGDVAPPISLLLTFHRLYQYASIELNKITERHLEYYFKEVLKLKCLKGESNYAFLNIVLNDGVQSMEVNDGELLSAGTTEGGDDILYQVVEGTLANEAFFDRLIAFEFDTLNDSKSILSKLEIPPELYSINPNQDILNDSNSFGFAFASQFLNLEEGHRKVVFTINLEIGSNSQFKNEIESNITDTRIESVNEFLCELFSVSYSSHEKWIQLDTELIETKVIEDTIGGWSDLIQVTVLIPDTKEPVTTSIDPETMEESFPEFKFLLNPRLSHLLFSLKCCLFTEIDIFIEILGVKNLLLSNDFGVLNQDAPFNPFGTNPILGSSFYVGHAFLFNYPLEDFTINIEWFGLPLMDGGFDEYYDGYSQIDGNEDFKVKISALKNKSWFPDEDKQIVDLFQRVPNQEENTVSSFRRLNEFHLEDLHLNTTKIYNEHNEAYSSLSISGFLKLELCYPLVAFGHDSYPNVVREAAMKRVKKKDHPHPNEPYTPVIKELTVDMSSKMSFNETNQNEFIIKHIYPFGSEIKRLKQPIVPAFEPGSTLFLGLDKLNENDMISLFFRFNEGTVSELMKVTFSVYDGSNWQCLEEDEIISDGTSDFKKDGIIKLNLKKAISNSKCIFLDENRWLKIESNGYSFFSILEDLSAHAVKVECISQDLLELENIGSEEISEFVLEKPEVDRVIQKYPSFGGIKKESNEAFYRRVSERLKHKDRALGIRDYERIILQEYPQVYRCICFNHRDANMSLTPGKVLITVIPALIKLKENNKNDAFFSSIDLNEMTRFINSRSPIQVSVKITNPSYERVRAKLNVKFNNGYEPKYYIKKLDKDIKSFISPFIYSNHTDIDITESIQSTRILNFIENLFYIDHILNFSLFHIVNGVIVNQNTAKMNSSEISPSSMTSILISDDSHDISLYDAQDITDKSGINEMMIGTDYIVDQAENNTNDGINHMVLEKNYRVPLDYKESLKEKSNFMLYLNFD